MPSQGKRGQSRKDNKGKKEKGIRNSNREEEYKSKGNPPAGGTSKEGINKGGKEQ